MDRFQGIVLFQRAHRNHDSLVKIFTREFGKRMFFVRRGQEPNQPLKSQLIPLTTNHYMGHIHNQGLSFIQEGQTESFHRHLQMDHLVQAHGVYLGQLMDAVVEDQEVVPDLYDLLAWSLNQLDAGIQPEVITAYVELHLLPSFGISLNWQDCQVCHEREEPFDFSVKYNGLLCHRHWEMDERRLHIPPRSMHIAYLLANLSMDQMGQVSVSPETLQGLRRLMDEIYEEYVGIRLRGRSYLNRLADFEASMTAFWDQAKKKDSH